MEKVIKIIDELISEAQKEPMWKAENALRCLKKELLKEQKHGHWVLDPDGMDWNIPAWCCSVCHCRNYNIPPNIEKVNPLRWEGSKFCPNCGAKMDEEVKQDDRT